MGPKHIVIVKPLMFDANDYERFDIEYMLRRGMRVTIVDVADIVIPESPRHREAYADWPEINFEIVAQRAELPRVFGSLNDADLVVNFVSDRHVSARNLFVLRAISRMKAPSLILAANAHPGFVASDRVRPSLASRIRELPAKAMRTNLLNSLLGRMPCEILGVQAADIIIHGGRRSLIDSALTGPATKKIYAHSFDFDRIMRLRKSMPPQSDTAVFIDQGVIGHREYLNPAMRGNFNGAQYFQSLRTLFDRIETETGLRVVIAAHPNSTLSYDQGEFGAREIVRGRSIEMVAASQMVVYHNSALIGAAVALNKPILMITSREDMYRRGSESAGYHHGFARALGKEICFLDEIGNLNIDAATRIDRDAYHKYIVDYMKLDDSPDLPFWQIVLDSVNTRMSVEPLASHPAISPDPAKLNG